MYPRVYLVSLFFVLSIHSLFSQARRPNVVFMYADDMGYGEVQALNPERGKIPTPFLDQLVADGLTFTNGHTASSVCTPSRYALLTGRYSWRTRQQRGVIGWDKEPLIAEDRYTMGKLFQDAGYKTVISGKWHLGFEASSDQPGTVFQGGPLDRGFDTYFGFHHAGSMETLIHDDTIIETIDPIDMLPRTTQFVVDFINEHAADAKQGKPFFVYVPFGSPHTPIVPTEEWIGKSGLGTYGDFVMMTDGMAGKIINAIDANGLRDNTIVIFSADNGTSRRAGIPKLQEQGHYPSAHFRGSKADLWEGGHRVPLIMRWPQGPFKAGTQFDQLVSLKDFITTFADILGVKVPENQAEDSFSFWKNLQNPDTPPARDSMVFHSFPGKFAVQKGKWKLLLARGSGGWTKPDEKMGWAENLPEVQLYDMEADVGETTNLQAQYPEKVEQLTSYLTTLVERGRSTEGPNLKNDVEDIDILKASYGQPKKKKEKK